MVKQLKIAGAISLSCLLGLLAIMLMVAGRPADAPKTGGTIRVSFINTVNHQPLALNDSSYKNPAGETYTVSKFKYYISNIQLLGTKGRTSEKDSYHLVDQNDSASLSFSFPAPANALREISFLIGVDSMRNVSGIQSGALDPANDMFWTWKSGYIMAKLEGRSPASTAVNNRVEYHIGGYGGENNAIRKIILPFPLEETEVKDGETLEITIEADINAWWNSATPISIGETPVCAVPGPLARKIAENYSHMFTIVNIARY